MRFAQAARAENEAAGMRAYLGEHDGLFTDRQEFHAA